MKPVTVMISCVQREAARALTIPQLATAGYPPRVFLSACAPAGPESNLRVSLEAMEWAETENAPVLFTEDDIDLSPEFGWCVDRALELDALTYLYLNDNPKRMSAHYGDRVARAILSGWRIERRAYEIEARAALFGTQCVLIPQRLVPGMVAILRELRPGPPQPWDGRLHLWARQHLDERVFVMLPHPVQHREDRTAREPARRRMRSLSFGMPAWGGEDGLTERVARVGAGVDERVAGSESEIARGCRVHPCRRRRTRAA